MYYDERIPKTDNKFSVPIVIRECTDGEPYYNISVKDVTVNGVKLTRENSVLKLNVRNELDIL